MGCLFLRRISLALCITIFPIVIKSLLSVSKKPVYDPEVLLVFIGALGLSFWLIESIKWFIEDLKNGK